jgi:hypothetical protein
LANLTTFGSALFVHTQPQEQTWLKWDNID